MEEHGKDIEMKAKLTIMMDETLIPKAKQYAKNHGSSLSALLEESIKKIIFKPQKSISEKWRGKLNVDSKNTPRFKKLADKYL